MLWWLITIPVFVIAYIIITKRKQRQLMEFGDPELMAQLMPDASKSRPIVKFTLLMVALALLIVAAARPQYGQQEKTETSGHRSDGGIGYFQFHAGRRCGT